MVVTVRWLILVLVVTVLVVQLFVVVAEIAVVVVEDIIDQSICLNILPKHEESRALITNTF